MKVLVSKKLKKQEGSQARGNWERQSSGSGESFENPPGLCIHEKMQTPELLFATLIPHFPTQEICRVGRCRASDLMMVFFRFFSEFSIGPAVVLPCCQVRGPKAPWKNALVWLSFMDKIGTIYDGTHKRHEDTFLIDLPPLRWPDAAREAPSASTA